MAFDPKKVRLERFRVELRYHAAYNYLSLKGVLAERWAHGPLFGAFVDQGNQVTLTPEKGFAVDRVDGIYGLRASSFDREKVSNASRSYEQAIQWLSDVVEVLGPKRTTRATANWFGLYPLSNIDAARAATNRLVTRYYSKDHLKLIQPKDFEDNFVAVNGLSLRGDLQLSYDLGVIGPPHKGTFFGVPDEDRDSKWWMGVKITLTRDDDDGIGDPVDAVKQVIQEGSKSYENFLMHGLASVF